MEAPGTPSSGHSGFQIPQYILDDLCSRFIINIPEEERQDLIRVFFQIELAHWFYLDFYCQDDPSLKACGIKDFSSQVFRHCPTLIEHADNVDRILGSWREYKMAVPTYGAIMLDPQLQNCLLVQGFWSKASWGFPKGKVNEGESAHDCAIREVLEETGFDISGLFDEEEYIEFKMNEQLNRLYIVPGVSMKTNFQPRTRNEIKKVQWFCINYLPVHKKDLTCKSMYGLVPNNFFMVIPYVKSLRRWISKRAGKADGESDHNVTGSGGKQNRQNKSKDTTVLTDRQRQKQQQMFSQQTQNDYGEYMNYKETGNRSKNKDQRTKSASPTSGRKLRQQAPSPKSNKKQLHILKRDGTVSGIRRSLATQFTALGEGKQRSPAGKSHPSRSRKDQFQSEAWLSFKLDVDAVMKCFNTP